MADKIIVTAVGDLMLGSTYPTPILPPNDGAHLLDAATPLLKRGEIVFGNLEGPLSDKGSTDKGGPNSYAFRVPTRYAAHLKAAGFNVLSVANNHINDFGKYGRNSTLYTLNRVGIRHSGGEGDIAQWTTSGGRKVALIGFAPNEGCHKLSDVEGAKNRVRELAADGSLVIVSFHGGGEGSDRQHVKKGTEVFLGEDRGDLRRFARGVVEAGADLVLGHGPHVLRGMEVYCNRLIAYSLGNFATYARFGLNGPTGLSVVLEVHLNSENGAFTGGQLHAMKQIGEGVPTIDPKRTAIQTIQKLSLADFPKSAPKIGDDGTLSMPGAPKPAAP